MVHSIQPLGKGRVIVGISAAGTFRTCDGGKTWEPFNGNVRADFLPDKLPEVGQCVHKIMAHPRHREAIYQQNHCGIYRARFALPNGRTYPKDCPPALDWRHGSSCGERNPVHGSSEASGERYVPKGRLRVARTRDGGKTWKLLSKGLPQRMRIRWFFGKQSHPTIASLRACTSEFHPRSL